MEIKELDFIPVLLGSDINTYSMARAFHEAYKVKSKVIGI
jgi:D-aspartate ligase